MRIIDFFSMHSTEIVIGLISSIVFAIIAIFYKSIKAKIKDLFILMGSKKKLCKRILNAGISNFYVGRNEWLLYRNPPNLTDYLLTATKSVQIATYWLAQGTIEGVQSAYIDLASRGIVVDIVMIDSMGGLPSILSSDIKTPPEVIKQNVENSLSALNTLRDGMPPETRRYFRIGVSKSLPQAAAILIDAGEKTSKLQLEFRPHGLPRSKSFSLELVPQSKESLHTILELAWRSFFDDANY